MTPRELDALVTRALGELDLASLVARALPARPRHLARVVAIGKAAPAMARGALARWGDRVEAALVVAPDGVDARGLTRDPRVTLLRAAHPAPDRRSLSAGRRALAFVASAAPREVLVLVSGGASSLVCAPAPGVSLRDLRAVTRAMLASGALVHDVNVVRKHLSRVKGGGLARAAWPSPVRTLVASDVVGGAASDVGSGPSVADPSTVGQARRLLARYAPDHAALPLARTLSPRDGAARGLRARLIVSPESLARVVARRLRERGLSVRVLSPSQAPAVELAAAYARIAQQLSRGAAVVRAAEPTIRLPARGPRARTRRGGRSTHLAALVARDLPRGAVFGAFATDGVDGDSGTAGAIVTSALASADEEALDRAIAAFDTGPLHLAFGTARPSRPTGHNLADLHVLVRG